MNPTTIEYCPTCDSVGKPVAVTAELGRVLVHFRCDLCHSDWEKITPDTRMAGPMARPADDVPLIRFR
jgi:hypothetical protein